MKQFLKNAFLVFVLPILIVTVIVFGLMAEFGFRWGMC